jgi:uncharacterized protein (DUF849 family)
MVEANSSAPVGMGTGGNIEMSPEQQKAAVERLRKAMVYMNQAPEALLALLERLEIPWEKKHFKSQGKDYLFISWEDLLAGEARNQEQGSVLKRLYGNGVDNV